MTLQELRASVRKKTHTNSSNYPDETLDQDINNAYGKVWLMLQEAEGYRNTGGDFEVIDFEDSTNLTEQDLGYNGEYPIPVGDDDENIPGAVSILEVHVDYGDGYKKAEIINRSSLSASMFSDDNGFYSEQSPKVFIFRDSYFVRPKNETGSTITDGIKLLTMARQPELIEATDEPIFERNLHELVAYYTTYAFWEEYPEKYNAFTRQNGQELESQAISLYESRIPLVKRFTGKKEKW